jgi:hypothetical protein
MTYRYDPTAFREVFERRYTYLAGVERNSHRFASRPQAAAARTRGSA